MKTKLQLLLALVLAICATNGLQAAAADDAIKGGADEPTEISFQDLPINDVISTLARMAGMNIMFDQKLAAPASVPGAAPVAPPPRVTIKWEKITPRQAMAALLDNYGYVATTDPVNKVTRISQKDPAAQEPLVLKVTQLKYSQATNLVTAIKAMLSTRAQVHADVRTSQIIVVATDSEHASVSNLLAKIDGPLPQVLIEANFMSTSKNLNTVKGIDWSDTLAGQRFTFGNGMTTGTTETSVPGKTTTTSGTTVLPSGRTVASSGTSTESITRTTSLLTSLGAGGLSADTMSGFSPHTAFLNADGVSAVLSFLNTDGDTESIATPRAVAQSGVPTELSVVKNIPVFEEQQGSTSGGVQNANTAKPNYELRVKGQGNTDNVINEVGVKLVVTPLIVEEKSVQLELRPETSELESYATVRLSGKESQAPIFARRYLKTTARVPSGSTLVLGGLLEDRRGKAFTKVPLLGDIPILGYAFRKDSKTRAKSNLIIFVTPTIVSEADFQPTGPSNFLKSKPEMQPDLEAPAWDSGRPMDRNRSLF